jgi:N-acyl-D-aspartate/D-glutamate deacylase
MGLDHEKRKAAYRDPAWRAATWEELTGARGGLPFNWASVSVAESPSHPELVDRSVIGLAEERDCTPLDVVLDISLDDDLKSRFWSVLANDDPDAIAWLLPRDNVLLGLADSGAHVSQLCDACFATDLLGNWVRDRKVMSLERAVHKLTAEPAGVYGLADRGSVEVGKAADLCVFDPDVVDPGPLRRVYDFPADGERLTADRPLGMTHVLVNGVVIRTDGEPVPEGLDARPGALLRS